MSLPPGLIDVRSVEYLLLKQMLKEKVTKKHDMLYPSLAWNYNFKEQLSVVQCQTRRMGFCQVFFSRKR